MTMRIPVLFALCLSVSSLLAAAERTWTGKISDSMCDKDHSMMATADKHPDAKKCTLECVKGGMKFVFVSDGNIYQIANQDLADLKKFAGNSVTLTGQQEPVSKAITVDKLVPAR